MKLSIIDKLQFVPQKPPNPAYNYIASSNIQVEGILGTIFMSPQLSKPPAEPITAFEAFDAFEEQIDYLTYI